MDNAVAESFFYLLKRERINRKTYKTRDDARQDGDNYIELFYNPKRKHARNGMLSPLTSKTDCTIGTKNVSRKLVLSQSFTRFQYHFGSVICLLKNHRQDTPIMSSEFKGSHYPKDVIL